VKNVDVYYSTVPGAVAGGGEDNWSGDWTKVLDGVVLTKLDNQPGNLNFTPTDALDLGGVTARIIAFDIILPTWQPNGANPSIAELQFFEGTGTGGSTPGTLIYGK